MIDWSKAPSIKSEPWVTVDNNPELTEEQIHERNRRVVIKHLAVTFIQQHGEHAIMRAMEEMLGENAEAKRTTDRWREVINEIERIQNESEDLHR